ncbi:hypothetical protein NPIL_466851 [Nephila pilipes]|uniref:Uncharacterized protein n=1 Tax=Nephila pilipes TaxID=299642 RepID=A0A8X6PWJ4_NEPPI|nr:hypothetical protein NPIL_466851 [Nephila pilipes]
MKSGRCLAGKWQCLPRRLNGTDSARSGCQRSSTGGGHCRQSVPFGQHNYVMHRMVPSQYYAHWLNGNGFTGCYATLPGWKAAVLPVRQPRYGRCQRRMLQMFLRLQRRFSMLAAALRPCTRCALPVRFCGWSKAALCRCCGTARALTMFGTAGCSEEAVENGVLSRRRGRRAGV